MNEKSGAGLDLARRTEPCPPNRKRPSGPPIFYREGTGVSIRGAAKRREKADTAKREATDDLRRYCEAARRAGVSITQIASEAGLSARAFTTCWRSDLSQVGVELAFGRDRDLQALGGSLFGPSQPPRHYALNLLGASRTGRRLPRLLMHSLLCLLGIVLGRNLAPEEIDIELGRTGRY
jgi:hypothetical protein